jgi:hypothetical protein
MPQADWSGRNFNEGGSSGLVRKLPSVRSAYPGKRQNHGGQNHKEGPFPLFSMILP